MFDRKTDELIERNHYLLAVAAQARSEAKTKRDMAIAQRVRAQIARQGTRPLRPFVFSYRVW
jgi:hypothetical protein